MLRAAECREDRTLAIAARIRLPDRWLSVNYQVILSYFTERVCIYIVAVLQLAVDITLDVRKEACMYTTRQLSCEPPC